jgi:hypothetical protein
MSLIALALAAALAAPEAAPTAMHMRGPPPPEKVSGDHAVLPMSFTAGIPTLSIMIDGKGPFLVGFDTGAMGGPHMTARLVEALGLQPVGEAHAGDPSGRNLITIKLYPIASEQFGDVKVEGWVGTGPTAAAPAGPGAKLAALDAIVGPASFDGYVITVDYPHGRFSLDRGALPPADGKSVFDYSGPIAGAPLEVEGRTIMAHLDTGNIAAPVIVPADFADRLAHKDQARKIGEAHTVSNTIEMFQTPIDGRPRLGGAALDAAEVGYPAITSFANVGSLALKNVIVRVDPKNHRVSLEAVQPAPT